MNHATLEQENVQVFSDADLKDVQRVVLINNQIDSSTFMSVPRSFEEKYSHLRFDEREVKAGVLETDDAVYVIYRFKKIKK